MIVIFITFTTEFVSNNWQINKLYGSWWSVTQSFKLFESSSTIATMERTFEAPRLNNVLLSFQLSYNSSKVYHFVKTGYSRRFFVGTRLTVWGVSPVRLTAACDLHLASHFRIIVIPGPTTHILTYCERLQVVSSSGQCSMTVSSSLRYAQSFR